MPILIRVFFVLLCALGSGTFSAPSQAALPRVQTLVPDGLPAVDRGENVSISFTATRSISSIVRQVTFFAPDGLVITGIGPGKTGAMPQCQVANPLPSNYVTCVSKVPGNAYFPFAPVHSIALNMTVDATANTGTLTGVAQLEQRYDGVHETSFAINALSTTQFNDDVGGPVVPHTRNFLWPFISAIFYAIANVFVGLNLSSHPPAMVKFPPVITSHPFYVQGTSGTGGNRYSAVGKVAIYDLIPNAQGEFTIQQGHCSGVIVPSQGKNLLMTAAHCLLNINPSTQITNWYSRLSFCPGMTEDSKIASITADNPLSCPPDKVYNAVIDPTTKLPKVFLNKVWSNILVSQKKPLDIAVAQYDLAFVELEPNSKTGRRAEEVHGSNGIVFNLGSINSLGSTRSVGYNAGSLNVNLCNRGAVLMAGNPPNSPLKGYVQLSKNFSNCNMRQGVSGGPWILNDKNDANNSVSHPSGLVFGVNSLGIVTDSNLTNPLSMWSTISDGYIDVEYTPIFRNWSLALYQRASGMQPIGYVP